MSSTNTNASTSTPIRPADLTSHGAVFTSGTPPNTSFKFPSGTLYILLCT